MAARQQKPAAASDGSAPAAESKRTDIRANEKKCCEWFVLHIRGPEGDSLHDALTSSEQVNSVYFNYDVTYNAVTQRCLLARSKER